MNGSDDKCVMLFVKFPASGQVKSRLGAELGEETAAELYDKFVRDELEMLEQVEADVMVCFDPVSEEGRYVEWLGADLEFAAQQGDDLGERMERAFLTAFAEGYEQAVLIGSDIPDIPVEAIRDAFGDLKDNDAVIGPSGDGGYYLIGFSEESFCADIFSGIAWSTERVLDDTMATLQASGKSVSVLGMLRDVDTLEDLRGLLRRSEGSGFMNSRTVRFVLDNDLVDIEMLKGGSDA